MYAKYDFRKKPSSKEDEDEQPLYPRIVSNGTIDFQQIVKVTGFEDKEKYYYVKH